MSLSLAFLLTTTSSTLLNTYIFAITLAKSDSVANRRLAFARMRSKAAVGKLFSEIGPRYQDRPGGYTRILKCGFRAGDAAPMAFIELVDRPIPEDDDDDFEDDEE